VAETGTEPHMLKVTLKRSAIGSTERQRQTLRALGLTRVGRTVIVRDNDATRGRITAVQHLIEVKS
jgi:large subunit ribosomal protein L30